ncbi:hypothetical protein TWF102_000361 [Orbilia oligospora]|uniref:Uncharacterized protein n=1 Tax=Orbilia oligospora TaxID=2813651 RepID=A0A7C8K128_ORBOL|nr:hypothetical protein TWF102_000361 [Orbilia oligospora]KAF3115937.1 hypothetical protein TWF103_010166 [Orbilia oligospora]KAF3138239.1 hypothetical protein TWF703_004768 [Orbilia oligospora]KAF3149634.1 hypothetical protein TWF594_010735 [Orbilia oligospora]
MERAPPVSSSSSLFGESIPTSSTEATPASFVPARVYHSILPGAGPAAGHGFAYLEIPYPLNAGYANNQGLGQYQTPLRPNAAYVASLEFGGYQNPLPAKYTQAHPSRSFSPQNTGNRGPQGHIHHQNPLLPALGHPTSQIPVPYQNPLPLNAGPQSGQGFPQSQGQFYRGVYHSEQAPSHEVYRGAPYDAIQGYSQYQVPLMLDTGRSVNQGSVPSQNFASPNARPTIIPQNVSPTADDRLLNSQNSNISHEAIGYLATNPAYHDAKLPTVQENPPSSSPPRKENKSSAVKDIAGQIKGFDKEKKNKFLIVLEKAKTKKELEAVDSKKAGLSDEAVVGRPEQRPKMQEADVIAEAKSATNLAPEKHKFGNLTSHPAGKEGLAVPSTPRPGVIAEHQRALPLPTKRQLPEQNILSPVPRSPLRSCPPEISLLAPSPLSLEPLTKVYHDIHASSPANLSCTMKLTQGPLGEPSTIETPVGAVAEVKPVAEAKQSNIIRWAPPGPREHSSKTPEEGIPEKNSPMPQNTFWDSEFFFHGVASKPAAKRSFAVNNNKEKGKDEKGKGRAKSPEDRVGEEKLDDRYDWYQVDIETAMGRAGSLRVPFKLLQGARLGIWGQHSGQAGNTESNESANEGWLKDMKKKTEVFADSDEAVESCLTGNAPALPPAVGGHSIGPGPAEPEYTFDKVDEDQCGSRTWHELTRYWEDHQAQQVAEFNPNLRPEDRYFKVPTLGLLGSPLTSGGEVGDDYGEQARKRARLDEDLFMDQFINWDWKEEREREEKKGKGEEGGRGGGGDEGGEEEGGEEEGGEEEGGEEKGGEEKEKGED